VAWDFSTEPEFEEKLEWVRGFVHDDLELLEVAFPGFEYRPLDDVRRKVVDPLKQQVRDHGLWAAHLGPELGGQGFGAVKLTLLNEILGRATWASIVFGTQAPDTGNAEILAHFGTQAQKEEYLQPLLNGEIFSCFSMTEPQGGADPRVFTTKAVRDGDSWVINGSKYFSSNAETASFLICMAVTNPDVAVHHGTSMFLVPRHTEGLVIEDSHHIFGAQHNDPGHALVRYENVRVPADAMLGDEGGGFNVAQVRLAGGRIHHAMRSIGLCQRAIDAMCERAQTRFTAGSQLSEKQLVQAAIADSVGELMQFRLGVLYTAWIIDQGRDARSEIAALKVATPRVIESIVRRAIQVHGGLGLTDQMFLSQSLMTGMVLGLADGPTEVHQINLARRTLKNYKAAEGDWPSEFLGNRLERARTRFGGIITEKLPYYGA
jgi:acyl-CoA dehydrogenase